MTFYILPTVFRSSEAFFHTGWFVESLATQTLVLFVIRTAGRPANRPSLPLASTTILIVIAGLILPFWSLAGRLGFVPMPAAFFLFLTVAVITYLILVEIVKARLVDRFCCGRSDEGREARSSSETLPLGASCNFAALESGTLDVQSVDVRAQRPAGSPMFGSSFGLHH